MSKTNRSAWARASELAELTPESRNRYVDFLRAASILVVVTGHWLMAAPYFDDGSPQITCRLPKLVVPRQN
ncbi:MAG: acyltransferase [Myxococcales bacterium]|nr:acyltransferase [Myxococcales bacterium]